MMARFCRYADKVFQLGQEIISIRDDRPRLQIPAAVMDVELLKPGEGEVPAAKRMLERVFPEYGRFFDVVVADGLYLEAPFVNFCVQHGKHVLITVKGDHRLPAKGSRVPYVCCAPKKRIGNDRQHCWCWATTIPKKHLPSRLLWKAGHGRWELENDAFNVLGTHGGLDHCFRHDPTAIVNFVLMQSFYFRNLKPPVRRRFTLIAMARQLVAGLIEVTVRAPWPVGLSGTPP